MSWKDLSYKKRGMIIGGIIGVLFIIILTIVSISSCGRSTIGSSKTYLTIQSVGVQGSSCKLVVSQDIKNVADQKASQFSPGSSDGKYISLSSYIFSKFLSTIIFILIFGSIGLLISHIYGKIKNKNQGVAK